MVRFYRVVDSCKVVWVLMLSQLLLVWLLMFLKLVLEVFGRRVLMVFAIIQDAILIIEMVKVQVVGLRDGNCLIAILMEILLFLIGDW